MIESELIGLIQTVGFPIVVTLWFMFRTDKIISENTRATENLYTLLENKCLSDNFYNNVEKVNP